MSSKPPEPRGQPKAVDRGQFLHVYNPKKNALAALPYSSPSARPFLVLGIETSCDDTGAAVVSSNGEILGESLASQDGIHESYGGVVPGLARDAHDANIQRVIFEALNRAKVGMKVRERGGSGIWGSGS